MEPFEGPALGAWLDRDPRRAWDALVEGYSGLILGVLARYTRDPDQRMDAYLYVLEELQAQDFRRLRHFGHSPSANPCSFDTWLKLVVRNLYFDWFRHLHGRKSLPKEIQKLPALDQRVFKLVHWEGYSAQEAFEVLRGQENGLAFTIFIQKLANVESLLSPINRAKIRRDIERSRGPISLDAEDTGPPIEAKAETKVRTPEDEALLQERRSALWKLVEALPAEDRLILRLRFFEGLTAKQIARAVGTPEPMAIYRRIERICHGLRQRAESVGLEALLLEGDLAELADTPELEPETREGEKR